MTEEKKQPVTMRVRLGDAELEVTGPMEFVENRVNTFLKEQRELQPQPHTYQPASGSPPVQPQTLQGRAVPPAQGQPSKIVDIRTLRQDKQPSTDIQMAAVVAYYLSDLAPHECRKDAITPDDVEKYFKQAGHPLPKQPRFTLVNARTAGYFESVGGGAYKLNPVGHNLVAHGLPKSSENGGSRLRSNTKKPAAKKAKKSPKK